MGAAKFMTVRNNYDPESENYFLDGFSRTEEIINTRDLVKVYRYKDAGLKSGGVIAYEFYKNHDPGMVPEITQWLEYFPSLGQRERVYKDLEDTLSLVPRWRI